MAKIEMMAFSNYSPCLPVVCHAGSIYIGLGLIKNPNGLVFYFVLLGFFRKISIRKHLKLSRS